MRVDGVESHLEKFGLQACHDFYTRKQLLLSARLSHRNSVSVCLSVSSSVRPIVTRVERDRA